LSEKCEVWPFRGKDPFSGCEVEEGNGRSVEVDVKTVLPGRELEGVSQRT
jgi:hypothetical protein